MSMFFEMTKSPKQKAISKMAALMISLAPILSQAVEVCNQPFTSPVVVGRGNQARIDTTHSDFLRQAAIRHYGYYMHTLQYQADLGCSASLEEVDAFAAALGATLPPRSAGESTVDYEIRLRSNSVLQSAIVDRSRGAVSNSGDTITNMYFEYWRAINAVNDFRNDISRLQAEGANPARMNYGEILQAARDSFDRDMYRHWAIEYGLPENSSKEEVSAAMALFSQISISVAVGLGCQGTYEQINALPESSPYTPQPTVAIGCYNQITGRTFQQ